MQEVIPNMGHECRLSFYKFPYRVLLLHVLTGSKGGSQDSKTEVEEVGAEAAAAEIFVHSLAVAACGDMAAKGTKSPIIL